MAFSNNSKNIEIILQKKYLEKSFGGSGPFKKGLKVFGSNLNAQQRFKKELFISLNALLNP